MKGTPSVLDERACPPRRKSFFARLGPGLITGASDDDPSGIGTYSQAGAQYGYGLLWTMVFSLPLMAAIQEISASVGLSTGERALRTRARLGWQSAIAVGVTVLSSQRGG